MMTVVQLIVVMLVLLLAFCFGQAFATPTRWWVWIPTYLVGVYLALVMLVKPLNDLRHGIHKTSRRLLAKLRSR
jgi:hypothetical protein